MEEVQKDPATTEQRAPARGVAGAARVAERGLRLGPAELWALLDRNPVAIITLCMVIVGLVGPDLNLATHVLILGLLATSLNIIFGYGGLLSFGHSTFYGIAAYTAGNVLVRLTDNFWVALVLALAVTVAMATVLGWLCLRRRGVYFSMLTLAFNQILFYAAYSLAKDWTGGTDGLRGVPAPTLGFGFEANSIRDPGTFYFFVLAVTVVSLWAMHRAVLSPMGKALQAVRESETRALATGIDSTRVHWIAFVLAGAFAGVAGVLHSTFFHFVGLDAINWPLSGVAVISVLLGGRGTFVGPFLGTGIFLAFQEYLSRITSAWLLVLGVLVVLCVLGFPEGIWGNIKGWLMRAVGPRWQAARPERVAEYG